MALAPAERELNERNQLAELGQQGERATGEKEGDGAKIWLLGLYRHGGCDHAHA